MLLVRIFGGDESRLARRARLSGAPTTDGRNQDPRGKTKPMRTERLAPQYSCNEHSMESIIGIAFDGSFYLSFLFDGFCSIPVKHT